MPDEDVIDTMGDDMLEAMEHKNGNICDNSDSKFGEEQKLDDDTYSMSDEPAQNTIDNIYIWISEPTNGTEYLVEGNNFIYLSENGR